MLTKYLPVGFLLTVAKSIFPVSGRSSLTLITSLNLGNHNCPLSYFTHCGTLNACRSRFDLKRGNLACLWKNLLYATSRSRRAACRVCELISFIHTYSSCCLRVVR